jgi:hypothetical protein
LEAEVVAVRVGRTATLMQFNTVVLLELLTLEVVVAVVLQALVAL